MADNFKSVSSNPHDRDSLTTSEIMINVILALIPATVVGVYNFGYRAAIVILVCVCAGVLTGLLLGMNLPVTIPLWMAALGGIFAILVVKQLFGGLGQNFMNPALGARCFLVVSFAKYMTDFTYDGVS